MFFKTSDENLIIHTIFVTAFYVKNQSKNSLLIKDMLADKQKIS